MKPTTEIVTRAATVAPKSVNEEARTADVVWTTGARVLRGYYERYYEELSLDAKHVRMDRLKSGTAPLLANHDSSDVASVIGVVESARIEKGQGIARVRFAKDDPAADAVWNKVRQGILPNVSVGYRVYRFEKVEGGDEKIPTMRATDWQPMEISVVPIGADPNARFRSSHGEPQMEDEVQQNEDQIRAEAVRVERERVAGIQLAMRAGSALLPAEFGQRLITNGTPIDEARAQILNELARRSDEIRTDAVGAADEDYGRGHGYRLSRGDRGVLGSPGDAVADQRVQLMAEALAARAGGRAPSDSARQFMHMSAVDMARHLLEARGVSTRLLSRNKLIARAYSTTSDFPALLQETGNRMLQQGYASYDGGLKQIARESSVPDFRTKSVVRLGEAPTLVKVDEHGEYTNGGMAEGKESYRAYTYGRIFGISRQALVNDDLSAFSQVIPKFGRAAAEFVAKSLVDLLTSNPAMGDGAALFHANHGNLGTPGVLSITSLGEAFKLMRLQKGLDGVTPVDVTPRFLVVPAALEMTAKQITAEINPAKSGDVNPFEKSLTVVVDPRLDAVSETAWYLAADPNAVDGIEYAFLEGEPGPTLETQNGWRIDGTEFKCRLDFGCGVLDYRGLFKNAGA